MPNIRISEETKDDGSTNNNNNGESGCLVSLKQGRGEWGKELKCTIWLSDF